MRRIFICLLTLMMVFVFPAHAYSPLQDEWDSVHSIPESNGLYLVCRDDLWGVASRDGEVLIEPRFYPVPRFKNGYAVVSEINPYDAETFFSGYGYGLFYGLINARGEVVIDAEYALVQLAGGPDIAIVCKEHGHTYRYALMNLRGENLTGFRFSHAGELYDGFIEVALQDETTGANLCGVYNPDGIEILPPEFVDIDTHQSGTDKYITVQRTQDGAQERYELRSNGAVSLDAIAAPSPSDTLLSSWERITRIKSGAGNYLVYRNEKWGMVNADNEIIIAPTFCNEPEFIGRHAVVSIRSSIPTVGLSGEETFLTLDGLINDAGETVLPVEYDGITLNEDGSSAMLCTGDLFGYLDLTTGRSIEPRYHRASAFVGDRAAVAVQMDLGDDKSDSMDFANCWGMIDREGREIIPFGYDMLEISENGIAQVVLDFMYGYYDVNGNALTKLEYDRGTLFSGDYAAVAREADTGSDPAAPAKLLWGAINTSGKEVIPCRYDELELCENGLALVSLDGLSGFISMQNEIIIEPKYEYARVFIDGYAAVGREVPLPEDKVIGDSITTTILWGLIDAEGNEILPMEYNEVAVFKDGTIGAAVEGLPSHFEIREGAAVEIP